jgi:hypothetical protein
MGSRGPVTSGGMGPRRLGHLGLVPIRRVTAQEEMGTPQTSSGPSDRQVKRGHRRDASITWRGCRELLPNAGNPAGNNPRHYCHIGNAIATPRKEVVESQRGNDDASRNVVEHAGLRRTLHAAGRSWVAGPQTARPHFGPIWARNALWPAAREGKTPGQEGVRREGLEPPTRGLRVQPRACRTVSSGVVDAVRADQRATRVSAGARLCRPMPDSSAPSRPHPGPIPAP